MKRLATLLLFLCGEFLLLGNHATAEPKPPISEQGARNIILEYLAYHAPLFLVMLDDVSQLEPNVGFSDLEKAGIVKSRSSFVTACNERKFEFVVTEKGQRIAASRGWAVAHEFLEIPLGRFTYVSKSLSIVQKSDGRYAVTFRFRYDANFNVPLLLKWGKASDWDTRGGLTPGWDTRGGLTLSDWDTRGGLTLADVGNSFTRTVPLRYNAARGWWLQDDPRINSHHEC